MRSTAVALTVLCLIGRFSAAQAAEQPQQPSVELPAPLARVLRDYHE